MEEKSRQKQTDDLIPVRTNDVDNVGMFVCHISVVDTSDWRFVSFAFFLLDEKPAKIDFLQPE